MKKTFITYGDDNYADSLKRIKAEAEATGLFDEVRLYTPADLPEPFLTYTRTYRRGGGYWLWKPFVIKDALDKAAEGGGNEVITKWYETALNHPELFTDADSSTPQDARFREHRHDQAVLTACVCTATHPWRFGLKVEKVEHRYATGQAVFASRISNSATRGHTYRLKGRTVSLLEHIIVNPLRVLSTRIIFTLSSL